MNKVIFLLTLFSIGWTFAQNKVVDLSEQPNALILPDMINENSGLQYINGYLYTFNDSGGKAAIYKLETTTGAIVQTINLKGVKNIDFEDIAYDGKNLYIGDFGNNLGNRTDLCIYKLDISGIKPQDSIVNLSPRKLKFALFDQNDFNQKEPLTTNFDIEALCFYNGKLHLFTKEWSSYQTTHYTLDPFYVFQYAYKVDNFNVKCAITAADIVDNNLVLTGYTKTGEVYFWRFYDFTEDKFFEGKSQQIMLGLSPAIGQIEGITIHDKVYYISGEKFKHEGFMVPQKMYTVDSSLFK